MHDPHDGVRGSAISAGDQAISRVGHCAGESIGLTMTGLPLSARRTFSGVIGVSSIRTPIASKIALAIAGITGLSGPWPASFAPYGPSGSGDSTRIVSISGVSSVVGIL